MGKGKSDTDAGTGANSALRVVAGVSYVPNPDPGPNPNPGGPGMIRLSRLLPPQQSKYDPEEFIISSTDSKGHNEKFWFRAPGGLDRQIQIVMAAHKFPYKTPSDLLRHALVRHLHWLTTLEPDICSVMGQVQVVIDICREEQYQQDFNEVFDAVGSTIQRYLSGGHTGEALRTVARCRDTFMDMPEGFWRDQYMNELMKRFGYLLEGDGAVLDVGLDTDVNTDIDEGDQQ